MPSRLIAILSLLLIAFLMSGCAPGFTFESSNSICLLGNMEGCPGFKP